MDHPLTTAEKRIVEETTCKLRHQLRLHVLPAERCRAVQLAVIVELAGAIVGEPADTEPPPALCNEQRLMLPGQVLHCSLEAHHVGDCSFERPA